MSVVQTIPLHLLYTPQWCKKCYRIVPRFTCTIWKLEPRWCLEPVAPACGKGGGGNESARSRAELWISSWPTLRLRRRELPTISPINVPGVKSLFGDIGAIGLSERALLVPVGGGVRLAPWWRAMGGGSSRESVGRRRWGEAGGVSEVEGRMGSSLGSRGSIKVVVREVWSMKKTWKKLYLLWVSLLHQCSPTFHSWGSCRSSSPITGGNSGGGRIMKNKKWIVILFARLDDWWSKCCLD